MRIALDVRPLSTPIAGIGRYTGELLKRLTRDESNDWFAYSCSTIPEPFKNKKNLVVREGQCSAGLGTLFAQLIFPVWAFRDQIDVFWSPRHHLPLLLSRNCKTVVTIHDLVWKCCPETMTLPRRWVEQLLMPPSLKKADLIVTVSRSTAQDLISECAIDRSKLKIVTPGTVAPDLNSKSIFDEDITREQPYILFVGTLEPRKNLLRVLRAFSELIKKGVKSHRLVIAGAKGWGKIQVGEYMVKLGIVDYVELIGRVDDECLFGLYKGADFLLMPSLYEGFGLPLVEAMAFGLPVISSNVSSMPEVVGDAGLLVNPLDTKAIENAISSLVQNQQLKQDLKARAVLRAQNFSWDSTAHKMLKMFQQLK
ncbi:MAG: glycosyltransferase family 4 protein [Pseudomonadales bacterium]